MDKATAAEIEQRLTIVQDKLLKNIPNEQIIQAGMADWQYSEKVMRCFIVFAIARIVQAATAPKANHDG